MTHSRLLGAVLGLVALSLSGAAPPPEDDAGALLSRLKTAWESGDVAGYLSLWRFVAPGAEEAETEFVQSLKAFSDNHLFLQIPASLAPSIQRVRVNARSFSVLEPRGRMQEWSFYLSRGPEGFRIVGRDLQGMVDGLAHLSLDPRGFRADGLALRLEDFTLEMSHGTLFMGPEALGPTLLVFAGEGTVRVAPRPGTEREILRKFSGSPEMVEGTKRVFVRIHPADLPKVLALTRLDPDPGAPERFPGALAFYKEQVLHSFVLDADLPGSPWWVFPSLGDSLATFDTRHHGTLTFTVFGGEPEGISLFDRARARQICLYSTEGRETHYNEDDGRSADVLSHDLRVRFDPSRSTLQAEDVLKIQLLNPSNTLRLKLDGGLKVESITSGEGGHHGFFRVRGQDSLMVSLGPFANSRREIDLTVRYAGALASSPMDFEAQFTAQAAKPSEIEEIPLESVFVLTTRKAWYPQASNDDYALSSVRFDVPAGFVAVSGGRRLASHTEGGRSVVEFVQEHPGKYLAAVIGRIVEGESREAGPVHLHGFGVGRARSTIPGTLDMATEILGFYAEQFGPCPYDEMNLVIVESENAGGHSPPGMVLLAHRPPFLKGSLRDDPGNFADIPGFFLAHELAHQWWGQGVAGENYHERWLSEGMAQFAAALWVRRHYGEDQYQGVLRRLGRWAFKHNEEGPISLGYRLGQIQADSQIFRAVVYDKGAYVLLMLRTIVGEEGFRRALTDLQARERFRKIGTGALAKAIADATGRDVTPYLEEWIYGTTLPVLTVSHRTQGAGAGYKTTVEVHAEHLPGPVPLEVSVGEPGGSQSLEVTLPPEGGSWTIETKGPPRNVEINGRRSLLARVKHT